MTSLILKIKKAISNNVKNINTKEDKMSKNFVKCPNCNSEWNYNVRKDCPVCKNDSKIKKEKSIKNKKTNNIVNNDRDFLWETKIDVVENCSKAPKEKNVWLDPVAKTKISFLMKKFKNIEWLAYLLGEEVNNEFYINDIFVPQQEISTTSVDHVVCPEYNELPIIGVIHSHHNMNHEFSGIDDDYINQNHDLSIVVSNTGLSGQVRHKTQCGSFIIINANVKLNLKVDIDKESFEKKIDEKIKRSKTNYHVGANRELFNVHNSYQPKSFRKKFINKGAVTKEVEQRFNTGGVVINDKRKVKDDYWKTDETNNLNEEMEKIEKEMIQKEIEENGI